MYYFEETNQRINLWLQQRLPLEPKGPILEARSKLREILKERYPNNNQIFEARYISMDKSFFDVENVLIYNVGTGNFKNASRNGIIFKKILGLPPSCPDGKKYQHFHTYYFSEPRNYKTENECYQFSFIPPPLTTTSKLQDVWWCAVDKVSACASSISGNFSLIIKVTTPSKITNVAALIKPFIDGIICAMHSDRKPDLIAVERLALSTGWDRSNIIDKLNRVKPQPLGDRRILSCYRDYIKWDPADHLCISCDFIVEYGNSSSCSVIIKPTNFENNA